MRIARFMLLFALLAAPARAESPGGPFYAAVYRTITAGITHLEQLEDGTGFANGVDARHNALALLALLEVRQGRRNADKRIGDERQTHAERDLMRRLVSRLVDSERVFHDMGAPIDPGRLSLALSALALWCYDHQRCSFRTDPGAVVTVQRAMSSGVAALAAHQGDAGGWGSDPLEPQATLGVTAIVIAALSDARRYAPEAAAPLARALVFVSAAQREDGGAGAHPDEPPSIEMTAALLWALRMAGVPVSDPRAQRALRWLRTRWGDDLFGDDPLPVEAYRGLWFALAALARSADDGEGESGAMHADDFGHLDPADTGFDTLAPSAWFDAASIVMAWHDPASGRIGGGHGGSPVGPDPIADHLFALLALEYSDLSVCVDVDRDDDGLCDADDNCPDHFNPGQSDEDEGGIGDACDNCPLFRNFDQVDTDADGIGDLCDRYLCFQDARPELCDGIDNDCDGLIDLSPDAIPIGPAPCATGRVGRCAEGLSNCMRGPDLVCTASAAARDEICDLIDDDCDGVIDEGTRNRCGFCGPLPRDACNGIDDDCDGVVDEAAVCGPEQLCSRGRCASPCAPDRVCPAGLICADGGCVDPCAGAECPAGRACAGGLCTDFCADVACGEGRCLDGRCVDGDCRTSGCGAGERCRSGVCEADPCRGVVCPDDEFCRDGQCAPSCAEVACGFGESCQDGRCVPPACPGPPCPLGSRCELGICRPDPCDPDACPAGMICLNDVCADDPCAGQRCPDGQRCAVAGGAAQCVAAWRGPLESADRLASPQPDAAPPMRGPVDGRISDPPGDGGLPPLDQGSDGASAGEQMRAPRVGCACDAGRSSGPGGGWLWIGLIGCVGVRRRAAHRDG